jgi:ribosomal protein S18 acetylase RimI-like enzyme
MIFREMQDKDVEPVAALWRDCGLTRAWNDPYKDIAFARANETSTILVGEIEDRLAASVMAGHDGHRGMFYYIAVAPDLRGKGFGKQAVRAGESWLRKRGIWKINLLVRAENAEVRGFYERLGYEVNPVMCMGRRFASSDNDGPAP